MANDLGGQRLRLVQVFDRERQRLTRFARSRLAEASDAEDVVSEVVLRLFERADLLAQVEDLTAYLFRAVGNGLADLLRRRHPVEELTADHRDPAPSPDRAMEGAELRRRLDDALGELSAAERAVWVAVELEGETFRDLAERWGVPIGTLLSRKNRATKALRKRLKDAGTD